MSEEKIVIPIERKLKPCPFCGGVANIKMWCEPDTPYLVMCESCKASVKDYATEAEAVEAWNRRAERTAKVEVHSHPCGVSGKCCACGGDVYNDDPYCSHCGARLEWNE